MPLKNPSPGHSYDLLFIMPLVHIGIFPQAFPPKDAIFDFSSFDSA